MSIAAVGCHYGVYEWRIHSLMIHEGKITGRVKVCDPSSAKISVVSRPDPFLGKIQRALCVWLKNGYGFCDGTMRRGVQGHAEGGKAIEDHSMSLDVHDNFQPASQTSFE